jgi:hypothetical protein
MSCINPYFYGRNNKFTNVGKEEMGEALVEEKDANLRGIFMLGWSDFGWILMV